MRAALSLIAVVSLSIGIVRGSLSEPNLPQVGILLAVSPNIFSEPLQSFRQVLKERGFIEDQTFKISARYAPENPEQLRMSAAELVSLSPKVILTAATTATQAAKNATSTISIVFVLAGDPVGTGFVASLERPGGNITGVTNSGPELSGQRLALLKEAIPSISRVAIIGNSAVVQQAAAKRSIEQTAQRLGIDLLFPEVRARQDIAAALRQAQDWGAEGYVSLSQTLTNIAQEQIAELALKYGRPLVITTPRGAEAGALISLSDDVHQIFRTAGGQVAQILKGASPATIPVVKSSFPELVINRRTAKKLNLSLPTALLSKATKLL